MVSIHENESLHARIQTLSERGVLLGSVCLLLHSCLCVFTLFLFGATCRLLHFYWKHMFLWHSCIVFNEKCVILKCFFSGWIPSLLNVKWMCTCKCHVVCMLSSTLGKKGILPLPLTTREVKLFITSIYLLFCSKFKFASTLLGKVELENQIQDRKQI